MNSTLDLESLEPLKKKRLRVILEDDEDELELDKSAELEFKTLNEANKHPRDEQITFVENTHEYFLNGIKMKISVSKLKEMFTPLFDEDEIIGRMMKGKSKNGRYAPKDSANQYSEMNEDQIKANWKEKRTYGTALHKCIFRYYNDTYGKYQHMDMDERRQKLLYPDGLDEPNYMGHQLEIEAFLEYDEGLRRDKWVPYAAEKYIYHEKYCLAGSVDGMFSCICPCAVFCIAHDMH